MKGSVRKRGSTWSYRIDLGIIDNKRRQKEKGGFSTKKEAQFALNEALVALGHGDVIENKNITFKELYKEFIETEAPINRKPATIVRYKSLFRNHLQDTLGFMKIGNITNANIQSLVLEKTETMSSEMVRSIYNFTALLFKYALKREYLKKNPSLDITVPKPPRSTGEIKIYTKQELEVIRDRVSSTNLLTAFELGVNLGVRAGECYGLLWSDFDFDNRIVTIDKQLQYTHGKWSLTTLKTDKSYRTIKFGDNLKNYLLTVKAQQEENKKALGDYWKENLIVDLTDTDNKKPPTLKVDNFVNIKPDGEMLNSNSHKVIARIAAKELDIDFKFHNLRHTHATILLEAGLNPKYIQERLGHSKLEFTLRLYTHVTRSMEEDAAKALDNFCPQTPLANNTKA